jgi:hypothetical protein
MKAVVVTLVALIHPPTNSVPMAVVPPHGSWSFVNEPLEFVGRQEMVLLYVRSFSNIDAVPERKFLLD